MKTIKLSLLTLLLGFVACNKDVKVEEKEPIITLAENVFSEFPMESDTVWAESDLTNAKNTFNREQIITSIKAAILSGKMKAYKNYPNGEMSIADVSSIIVMWDTVQVEDPEKPGVSIIAPVKNEIMSYDIPFIKFNETVSLDTLSYSFKKTVSYVSLYTYKMTEKGETVGVAKLFDVK